MDDALTSLLARHAAEEAAEAERNLIDSPRPLGLRLPEGGRLPESRHWLDVFETAMVPEKKPCVFDHLRSWGPWMVSVDDDPLAVLDGMSQTATIPAGFSPDEVVAAYLRGDFGDTATKAGDTTLTEHGAAEAYRATLRSRLPAPLTHITFTSSGAEANEKALALCHAQDPGRRRVLAFEGSFHGRMLLTLHATWNPSKRGPFEFDGYQALFAPWPLWTDPTDTEPAAPRGFLELAGKGDVSALAAAFGDTDDALLAAEVASLVAVGEALRAGEVFACIVEPMQSEGGDRYVTARFHRALRLITRHFDIPLVYDEVQCGFGLGGTFFWHERFQLIDLDGAADHPDVLTVAKRAQVGVVASRFPDPQPTAAHPASLVRGRLHAELVGDGSDARRVEALVRPRLAEIATRYPELVSHPRARGYAVAFDLPDGATLGRYISQRFWRGAVVFAAGSRTVRYRLSRAWSEPHVELLFRTIDESLAWIETNPGADPPKWQDAPPAPRDDASAHDTRPWRIRRVPASEAEATLIQVLGLEARIFEPARRDPEPRLRLALEDPDGVALVAEVDVDGTWTLAGYAFACPLEGVPDIQGCDTDPLRGQRVALYSIAVSVAPEFRGHHFGARLKHAQVREARALRRPDGSPRYRVIVGRTRVGAADVMMRINRRFGAYAERLLDGQYGEPEAQALYYRIPLGPLGPLAGSVPESGVADLADGLAAPFGAGPESLRAAETSGLLFGPAVNKITICNYVSPAVARATEYLGQLTRDGGLPRLYLASSRDETVDKAIRVLRYARREGQVMLGVEGGYVGHTSAAARSLSDPASHGLVPDYFGWPRVPHPALGVAATMAALRGAVDAAGGPDRVLGLMLETVQELTGRVVPPDFWPALAKLRDETGLSVVVVETASACYRSGKGAFAVLAEGFVPDVLTWWGGGQTAFLHVTEALHVKTPLTFVSTWDGDELSMIRVHHHLRAAGQLDLAEALSAMDTLATEARAKGLEVRGLGLYRVLSGDGVAALKQVLAERGILVRSLPTGAIALAPRLDRAVHDLERFRTALDPRR